MAEKFETNVVYIKKWFLDHASDTGIVWEIIDCNRKISEHAIIIYDVFTNAS